MCKIARKVASSLSQIGGGEKTRASQHIIIPSLCPQGRRREAYLATVTSWEEEEDLLKSRCNKERRRRTRKARGPPSPSGPFLFCFSVSVAAGARTELCEVRRAGGEGEKKGPQPESDFNSISRKRAMPRIRLSVKRGLAVNLVSPRLW